LDFGTITFAMIISSKNIWVNCFKRLDGISKQSKKIIFHLNAVVIMLKVL
jgi:hypothetical protein